MPAVFIRSWTAVCTLWFIVCFWIVPFICCFNKWGCEGGGTFKQARVCSEAANVLSSHHETDPAVFRVERAHSRTQYHLCMIRKSLLVLRLVYFKKTFPRNVFYSNHIVPIILSYETMKPYQCCCNVISGAVEPSVAAGSHMDLQEDPLNLYWFLKVSDWRNQTSVELQSKRIIPSCHEQFPWCVFKDTLVPVCVGITVCASPLRAIMDNVCDWAEERNEICYLCTPAQTQYVDCETDRKKGWKSFVAAIALWRQRDGEKMMADGFKRLLAW